MPSYIDVAVPPGVGRTTMILLAINERYKN